MRELVKELLLHYEELRRHLTYKLRDSDRAADLAQTSFEQVYRHSLRSQTPDTVIVSPRALLFRVAHNLCVDEARHRQVAEGWASSHAATDSQNVAPSAEYLSAQRQLVEKMAQQIEKLPARRREVFLLFKAYGYTQAEIAQQLNITEMAVAKHVVRAAVDCARVFGMLRAELPDATPAPGEIQSGPMLAEEYC